MRRLFMLVLLVPAFCSVVFAQLGAIRDRGPHTLYGDIKVETEPGSESQKPLSLEVQLYIINGTLVGRETVSANGRYRFMDLANGEYDVVVMSENLEVARVRVRVQSVYKTDFRQDITLQARVNHTETRAATISAADAYERTGANKSLFEKGQKAADEKKYDAAVDLFDRLVAADPKDFQAWTELGTVQLMRNNIDEAEKAYRRAIQEHPTFTLALLDLGRLLSAEKKFEDVDALTRQIERDPSSETKREPSFASATPTGRPQTVPLGRTKPVRKSSYSPVAWPSFMGRRMTSYPDRAARFHDPCSAANPSPLYSAGNCEPS